MSKPKSSLTQDKMTAHNAKAMLVTCMDFRLREDIHKFMIEHGYDVNYDQFVLAKLLTAVLGSPTTVPPISPAIISALNSIS